MALFLSLQLDQEEVLTAYWHYAGMVAQAVDNHLFPLAAQCFINDSEINRPYTSQAGFQAMVTGHLHGFCHIYFQYH